MSFNVITVKRDNGDVIPLTTPEDFSWNIGDLDAEGSGRSKKGDMFRDRVAVKRKYGVGWGRLSAAEASKILTAVSDIFFDWTAPDAMTGTYRTMRGYVSDRTTPKIYVNPDTGEFSWDDLSFDVVER